MLWVSIIAAAIRCRCNFLVFSEGCKILINGLCGQLKTFKVPTKVGGFLCSPWYTSSIIGRNGCENVKKRSLLIGLSLLTGVASSLILRKEKQKTEPRQQFVGKWQFTSKMKDTVSIEITEEHSLTIDGKHSPTVIVELTPSRLVLLDSLGYHLIIEQKDQRFTLYDEAEDWQYPLTKIE